MKVFVFNLIALSILFVLAVFMAKAILHYGLYLGGAVVIVVMATLLTLVSNREKENR